MIQEVQIDPFKGIPKEDRRYLKDVVKGLEESEIPYGEIIQLENCEGYGIVIPHSDYNFDITRDSLRGLLLKLEDEEKGRFECEERMELGNLTCQFVYRSNDAKIEFLMEEEVRKWDAFGNDLRSEYEDKTDSVSFYDFKNKQTREK
jgi:tRNA(Ile)-lysidine synthase TilS/MesJ|tara:strand:- start:5656 stop:6096 length:441 start_codon:yes stop_codon:yes gene_type:complete